MCEKFDILYDALNLLRISLKAKKSFPVLRGGVSVSVDLHGLATMAENLFLSFWPKLQQHLLPSQAEQIYTQKTKTDNREGHCGCVRSPCAIAHPGRKMSTFDADAKK